MAGFIDQVVANQVTQSASVPRNGTPSPLSGSPYDLLDPANARRMISGLSAGGIFGAAKQIPNIGFQGVNSMGGATAAGEDDWRVRVSLADNSQLFYKDPTNNFNSILAPLIETNGVIWPYTPSITVTHSANYTSQPLTHSNYSAHFYNNSDVNDITVSGDFSVQSAEEGQYLMAAVYFLRAATKMFFGQGQNVGNPPPIVFLDGYGSHYFPHVPCVVTSFQHTLPPDVDYIQVPISQTTLQSVPISPNATNYGSVQLTAEEQQYVPSLLTQGAGGAGGYPGGLGQATRMQYSTLTSSTRVPTNSQVQVILRPVYSRSNLHNRFNLDDFAQGKLIADKNSGFGGFL